MNEVAGQIEKHLVMGRGSAGKTAAGAMESEPMTKAFKSEAGSAVFILLLLIVTHFWRREGGFTYVDYVAFPVLLYWLWQSYRRAFAVPWLVRVEDNTVLYRKPLGIRLFGALLAAAIIVASIAGIHQLAPEVRSGRDQAVALVMLLAVMGVAVLLLWFAGPQELKCSLQNSSPMSLARYTYRAGPPGFARSQSGALEQDLTGIRAVCDPSLSRIEINWRAGGRTNLVVASAPLSSGTPSADDLERWLLNHCPPPSKMG